MVNQKKRVKTMNDEEREFEEDTDEEEEEEFPYWEFEEE